MVTNPTNNHEKSKLPLRRVLRVAREFNIPIDEALRLLKGEANP